MPRTKNRTPDCVQCVWLCLHRHKRTESKCGSAHTCQTKHCIRLVCGADLHHHHQPASTNIIITAITTISTNAGIRTIRAFQVFDAAALLDHSCTSPSLLLLLLFNGGEHKSIGTIVRHRVMIRVCVAVVTRCAELCETILCNVELECYKTNPVRMQI